MKNSFVKIAFVFCFALLLAGCITSNVIKPESQYNSKTEGFVALKVVGEGQNFSSDYPIQVIIRKVDSTDYSFIYERNHKYGVLRLPAGDYYLDSAHPDNIMLIPPFIGSKYDPETALPFVPFRVEPGCIVYLGDITIKGAARNVPIYRNAKVEYKISASPYAEATIRQKIKQSTPEFNGEFLVTLLDLF